MSTPRCAERAADLGVVAQRRAASYTAVHRSLLAGFCTMVGARGEEGVYAGTRGMHFHIFPGSPLARRRPRWVMAANIVETSRVFARRVAEIEPQWIEGAARHLLKHEYLEPDWDEQREEVVARERIGFLGLTLSANRIVNYGPIAPEESRRIFAREALVYRRLERRPDWLAANDAAVREAERMEERLRTRNLLHGAEVFVDFYDGALPRQVSSAATLEHFTRHLGEAERRALTLSPELIYARRPEAAELAQFPETAQVDGLTVPVEYRFAPGEAGDGASLRIPLLALPGLTASAVVRAVPGLAAPRIEALLRSLPKEARRQLDSHRRLRRSIPRGQRGRGPCGSEGLAQGASRRPRCPAAIRPERSAGAPDAGTAGAGGRQGARRRVGTWRNCAAPRRRRPARNSSAARSARFGQHGAWRRFDIDELPRVGAAGDGGGRRLGVSDGRAHGAVASRCVTSGPMPRPSAAGAAALRSSRATCSGPKRATWAKSLPSTRRCCSRRCPTCPAMRSANCCCNGCSRRACFGDAEAPRSREAYEQAVDQGRARLHPCLDEIAAQVLRWFSDARAVRRALDESRAPLLADAVEESHQHLRRLLCADTLESMSPDWLRQVPRYLQAESRRWQRAAARGTEPPQVLRELREWSARYRQLVQQVGAELRWIPELDDLRNWIAEYRVSLVRPGTQNPGAGLGGAPGAAGRRDRGVDRALNRPAPAYTSKRIPCARGSCELQLMVLV